MYGLTSRARRAAISVPTNIAEGVARQGRREFARFLSISLGSLVELSYLLLFSRERGLFDEVEWRTLEWLLTRQVNFSTVCIAVCDRSNPHLPAEVLRTPQPVLPSARPPVCPSARLPVASRGTAR